MSTAGWRVPINVKLLAVLVVPVIGYLFIATTAVVRAQQAANRIRDQASVVRSAVGPTSLTTSLIDERTTTSLEANGLDDELTLRIGKSADARRATDKDLAALQDMVADNPEARDTYQPAIDDLDAELQSIRAEVDGGNADADAVFDRYSELIDGVIDANANAVERVDNAEFWQGAKLAELATRQKDARALLVDALIPVGLEDDHTADLEQSVAIVRALGNYENRDGAIHELATGRYARANSILIEATDAADLAELARETIQTQQLDPDVLYDLASYKGGFVYDMPTGDYIHDYFRANVVETLGANADARVEEATDRVRTHLIAGSLGLVVTTAMTWLVSRSIMRPLRSLTRQVIDTARRRLPNTVQEILATPLGQDVDWPQLAPIDVTSSDEIGDVAEAFNTMQQSALDLAVEEAMLRRQITDSLVTLGQRNQSLLSRQLTFITDLERSEADPDILADLFYLDHLAVRMRRNAELLLVLAGVDPPRKWVGPTPVGHIVRAALGEASEYKRVRVQDIENAVVVGSATAELSHLLAELIENALIFSPPAETVEVTGRYVPSDEGLSPAYLLTVEDFGVGMTPEDLAVANRRLAAGETTNVAPSNYMGHYIAGKLAARHGITVRLHAKPSGEGLTATIDIPAVLLTTELPSDTVSQMPPLPAGAGAGAAGPGGVGGSGGAVPATSVPPPAAMPSSPVHPPPTIPLPPILPLAPLVPLPTGSGGPPTEAVASLQELEELSELSSPSPEPSVREVPAHDFDSSELSLPDFSLESLAPDPLDSPTPTSFDSPTPTSFESHAPTSLAPDPMESLAPTGPDPLESLAPAGPGPAHAHPSAEAVDLPTQELGAADIPTQALHAADIPTQELVDDVAAPLPFDTPRAESIAPPSEVPTEELLDLAPSPPGYPPPPDPAASDPGPFLLSSTPDLLPLSPDPEPYPPTPAPDALSPDPEPYPPPADQPRGTPQPERYLAEPAAPPQTPEPYPSPAEPAARRQPEPYLAEPAGPARTPEPEVPPVEPEPLVLSLDPEVLSLDPDIVSIDLPPFAPDLDYGPAQPEHQGFAPPPPGPEPMAPEVPGDRAREFVVPNLPVQEPLDPESYDPDPYEPELAPPEPPKKRVRRKRPIAASRLPVPPHGKRGLPKGSRKSR